MTNLSMASKNANVQNVLNIVTDVMKPEVAPGPRELTLEEKQEQAFPEVETS